MMEQQKTNYKLHFDIATNFDKKLIDMISKYDDFKWVYGKMNNDIVGGGRPSIRLPKISWNQLADYVDYCHQHNIKFNYLLNALCLSGKEFQKSYHTEVIKLLRKIDEMKVDGVTIASPYLCQIVRKQFPHFFISVSVYNKVETLPQLKYWKDIGADEITVFHTINRDFKRLRLMLKYAKQIGLKIRLIANNSCLHECPFHANHAVTHSHGSKSDEKTRIFHFDYQILNCNLLKIKDPSRIISSEWIRPEDLYYYEDLCNELGCDNLSIKLTERGRNTEWLIRVANAYHNRTYNGNLIDILNYVGKGDFYGELHYEPVQKQVREKGYNEDLIQNYRESIFYTLPYIDNNKLNNFLKFFIENYQCDHKICDDTNFDLDLKQNEETSGEICSYCRIWAKKVIIFEQSERKKAIAKAEKALDDVNSSRIFYTEEGGAELI